MSCRGLDLRAARPARRRDPALPALAGRPARPAARTPRGSRARRWTRSSYAASAAAAELAHSGLLDPASSLLLADAVPRGADRRRGRTRRNREQIESSLSSALRAALDEEDVARLSATPHQRPCSTSCARRASGSCSPGGSTTTPPGRPLRLRQPLPRPAAGSRGARAVPAAVRDGRRAAAWSGLRVRSTRTLSRCCAAPYPSSSPCSPLARSSTPARAGGPRHRRPTTASPSLSAVAADVDRPLDDRLRLGLVRVAVAEVRAARCSRAAQGVKDGPVLVVKLDNTPNSNPHAGLEDADVVYLEQVEGGLTRYAAVFSTRIPKRSGRSAAPGSPTSTCSRSTARSPSPSPARSTACSR